MPATSLFVFIGAEPGVAWLPPSILRDEKGFVLAGPDLRRDGKMPESWREQREPFLLETSVPGVFVAGDVRHGSSQACGFSGWAKARLRCSSRISIWLDSEGWILRLD